MKFFRRKATRPGWGDYPRRVLERRSRWRTFFLSIVLLALVVVGGPPVFVGMACYDGSATSSAEQPSPVTAGVPGYSRSESLTYLTFPEWFIVYSAEEYAKFVEHESPSRFPYFSSIRRFWSSYAAVCGVTRREYRFEAAPHVMLSVIGVSFSIENALKGVYEATVGRATEALASRNTPEDVFAARTAAEYGAFVHTVPWYQFPFTSKLGALWFETPPWGPGLVRKWERRFALTAEYGMKAMYAWVIRHATRASFGVADTQIHAWIERVPDGVFADEQIRKVKQVAPRSYIVVLPRYEAFTRHALKLLDQRVRFVDIAGNDDILLTALAPRAASFDLNQAELIFSHHILTDARMKRIALRAPVKLLNEITVLLGARGATIEHLYDY